MRKIIPVIILFSILFSIIYNSKTEYYEKSKEFHKSYFSAEITKIKEYRGTKIYYDNDNYFYESDYDGIKLKVGDVIRKNDAEIIVTRKNSSGEYVEIGKGKSIKPSKSYFSYFFGN
ncbi:hypothetical protein [Flavobacterium sp. GSP14]|uniref:hypothetical protein n=1 Tax=Flavobacterium sp. GSP14 TaxID=3401734 RepID=UPI003AAF5329